MSDINVVTLIGRLTGDVKIRDAGETKVANFNLASNRGYKDKEEVLFIRCTLWGKLAETADKYCKKGDRVGINGHLKLNKYEKEGTQVSYIELVVNTLQFLNPPTTQNTESKPPPDGEKLPFDDEAIPF